VLNYSCINRELILTRSARLWRAMATRSLRNRMSSRFSSPAVTVDNESHGEPMHTEPPVREQDDNGNGDGEWREPPVRTLPPSYKDHKGLERVGVLELQQPLGVPPSQKLLQRLKLTVSRPSNRATPVPDDEVMSQAVESEALDTASPADADVDVQMGETENMAVSSPPRGRPSNREIAEMRSSLPLDGTPSPSKSNASMTPGQIKPTSIQEHLRQERVQNAVNRALTEAQENGNWGLVPGLEKIRKNANDKRELWIVLEAVASRNPTPQQLHIFKKFIKKGMKRHRRDSAHSDSIATPDFGSTSVNARLIDPALSSTAIQDESLSTASTPYRSRSSLHAQGNARSHQESPSTKRSHLEVNSKPQASDKSPRRRRRRSRSHSTSSSLSSARSIPDEQAPPGIAEDEGIGSGSGHGSRARRRQAGERESTKSSSFARSSRFPRQHQQSSTTPVDPSAVISNSSTKVVSDKLKKTQLAREEAEAEAAETERRRKRLLKDSYLVYNYEPRETLNDRYRTSQRPEDEDISHTADELATQPRPPVVHTDPARIYRARNLRDHYLGRSASSAATNGTARKRTFDEMSDDDDSDALTPLSSSPEPPFVPPPPPGANLSRAATPRASTRNNGPISKIARKSARVMVS
jgi:hypothetical protein